MNNYTKINEILHFSDIHPVDHRFILSYISELEKEKHKLKEQIDDILIGCYSAIESDLNDNLEILCRKLYKYGYLQKSDGSYVLNRSYDEERCSKRNS